MPLDVPTPPTAHDARWSILILDVAAPESGLEDGVLYEHGADALLRTASVAKVFALYELAIHLGDGSIAAGELLDRRSVTPVADSGLWQHFVTDRLPVADVATLIGTVSDNWATNVLVQRLGLDAVQALARTLAPGGSMLLDYVRDGRTEQDPETLSLGSARDWAGLMAQAHRRTAVSAEVSETALGWLAAGADMSMVAGGLALDPLVSHALEDDELRLWHKTGADDGARADVGLVAAGSRAVAYAVLCNWDGHADALPHVLEAMGAIGRRLAVHLSGSR